MAADKPAQTFTDWYRKHRDGVADADLTDALEELVAAVGRTRKKGTLTLKLSVTAEGDMVAIAETVTTSIPTETDARLYWVGTDGQLSRNNPLQPSLLGNDAD